MNPSFLILGWRSLWRDARAGELRLLLLAVTLAVAALSSVGFFADRIQGGLQRDARQLLGGDAVVAADNPLPAAFTEQAKALGLQAVTTLSFPTMGRAPDARGGASRLVALKAVAPGYPLRGSVQLATQPGVAGQTANGVPQPGTAWVEPALLDALQLNMGDTLLLGDRALVVQRIIVAESDRGAGFMNFAPRVMIHEADLPATGLVQPASRITYRLAVAGEEATVRRYSTWASTEIERSKARGQRVETLESGRPEMRQTLDRAEKFLHLVALLSALLSAVAVALAARSFAARHLDACALLRVLGLSQRTLALAYMVEFTLTGLLAGATGVALGYALHHVFVGLLANLVDSALPAPGLWPAGVGLGIGLTLMAAFGLPPVLQLAQVPALRVIRRELGTLRPASATVLGLGLTGFAALLWFVSADARLGTVAVVGFALALGVFAAAARLAIWVLRRLVHEARAPRWLALATRQVAARPLYTVVQTSALAVGLLALVLLVLLRTDLVASWQRATPADAANRFIINLMPEQAQPFQQALREAGVTQYDWYPMMRGRLVAINGREVAPADFPGDRAQRLLDREFNLSHAAQQPAHNLISAGRWVAEEADAISVEEGIATTLGLKLGDQLRFDMGALQVQARITSLRKVDWGSMRANFFVMFPVSQMPDLPVTYMSAFRAPAQPGFDHTLVQRFPNITQVDMSAALAQVQQVLGQVIQAVEFLFGFALLSGLVVLLAAVSATRDDRERDMAVMRALGASAALLRRVQRAELAGVGLLAGLMAGAVASAIGWVLARQVFEFELRISLWVPLAGAAAGAALAMLAGWWSLRGLLQRPVVDTLRQTTG